MQEKDSSRRQLQNELYRSLYERAADSIFLMEGLRFADCNPRTLEMFGCTREQIIGKEPFDFSPETQPDGEASREKGGRLMAAVLAGSPRRFAWRHKRLDGTPFDAEVSLNFVQGLGRDMVLAIVRDRTESVRAETALRESEHRFRNLMENTTDAVFCCEYDPPIPLDLPPERIVERMYDGILVECNVVAARFYGAGNPNEVMGKKLTMLFRTGPGGLDELFRHFVRDGFRIVDGEGFETMPDGSRRYYLNNANGVVENSALVRVWGTYRDITHRKHHEEQLRTAFAEIRDLKDRLEAENVYLRGELRMSRLYKDIVGQSDVMKTVLAQAEQVASTDTTVLIQGETGTGKELLARAIHAMSRRKRKPLIIVNCAAIPSTLVESELFGREKGAYTGALTRQAGRFEVADGSTLFLDEISELPMETQAKLLRVLQEGKFERLGSTQTRTVNVRVIAATNRDLEKQIEKGLFRQDLFYRINVFPLTLPALRERREDIPALVWTFVNEFSEKMGKRIEKIGRAGMEDLKQHDWPGNVRELRNAIERAMIQAAGPTLHVRLAQRAPHSRPVEPGQTLEEVERRHILDVLHKTAWRIRGKGGAAEQLGFKPTTLEARMKKMGIRRP